MDQNYKQTNRFGCIGIWITQHYFTAIRVKDAAKLANFERSVVLNGLIVISMTMKFHVDDSGTTVGPSQVGLLRYMGLDLKK